MEDTTVPLREYIEKILEEKDKRLDVIHNNAKDAVKVAYDEASKRLTEHNGLLQKMEAESKAFEAKFERQSDTFFTKVEGESLEKLMTLMEKRIDRYTFTAIGIGLGAGVSSGLVASWLTKLFAQH